MTNSDISWRLPSYLQGTALAANSRLTFDTTSLAAEEQPRLVRLSDGPSQPGIICIPSTVALSGPHQYLEFAQTFRDIRALSALSVPGFVGRERVPATVEVAVEVVAQAAQRAMGDAPVVLAGYSAGGTLAYGAASRLEHSGVPVAAVVLIDTYSLQITTDTSGTTDALLRRMFDDPTVRMYLTDTRLTAMMWYGRLLEELGVAGAQRPHAFGPTHRAHVWHAERQRVEERVAILVSRHGRGAR